MKNVLVKNKKWFLTGAGLIVIIVAVIFITGSRNTKADSSKSVQLASNKSDESKGIVSWGEVKYNVVYDISIDFPSFVTSLDVKEGDKVKLGQSLVTLDISEYKANVDKLEQQVSINEAGLKTVTQDVGSLDADIIQLQKDIQRKTEELGRGTNANLKMLQDSLVLAMKDADKARQDVQNYEQLYTSGAISRDDLDKLKLLLDQKEKAVSDVRNNIDKLKRDLQTEIDQLNISLKYKQAQYSQLNNSNSANSIKQNSSIAVSKIDLDNMKAKSSRTYIKGNQIVSCVENGVVKNIKVVNGSRLGVQFGPTAVMQLIDMDSIYISAEVDEEFIKNVSLGETVKIVPEFDKNISVKGTVTQISNLAVEKDGKRIIIVQVKPEDPDGLLRPGFTADVNFPEK